MEEGKLTTTIQYIVHILIAPLLRYASGNGSMYDGSQLVRESNNQIIAVVVQYRLGLFGTIPLE